jgi:hypothetical protein
MIVVKIEEALREPKRLSTVHFMYGMMLKVTGKAQQDG